MSKARTQAIRRVHDETPEAEDAFIEIAADPDGARTVRVKSDSREWFGNFEFAMPPEVALAVGRALLKTAEEILYGTT